MPKPNKGEKERDYIKRCVPVLIHEGKDHDQAVAVCYGMWDEHQKKTEMARGEGQRILELDAGDIGGHWVTIDEHPVFIKDPIGQGRGFSRAELHRKIIAHHESIHGDENLHQSHTFEEAGGGGSIANRTFYKKLPGEVTRYIEGNPNARRLFSVTQDAGKAGGEDALASMGEEKYTAQIDRMAGNKLGAALETARSSADPEVRFMAAIHDNMPPASERVPQSNVPANQLRAGQKFTIQGQTVRVVEHPDGYKVLQGADYPETPLESLRTVPVDKGSLRSGSSGGSRKSVAPFSRGDNSTVLILNADTSAFADAVTLGQGLPNEKNGQRCGYFWKEALPLGKYRDKNGNEFDVTPQRIQNLLLNFTRAKSKGFLPRVPDGHTTEAKKNLGFVVDARKNAKGNLELMTQMIGDDAILATARNKASICTIGNFTDEHGDTYDELIDHLAVVPDPQLNNLDDFQPVLAASRAAAAETVVLQLAAEEPAMDLTKLREAIGAKKEDSDVDVITATVAKLGEGTKALELSRTSGDALKTEKDRADKAEKERDALNTKVLELSRASGPDPVTLEDRRQTAEEVLTGFIERGQCTEPMAKVIRENFLGTEGKPCLLLSRGARSGEVGAVFKLLELNKSLSGFQQTGGQPVPRSIPGAGEKETVTNERLNELRQQAGLAPVKAA